MKVECGLEIVDNICGECVMIDLIFGRRHNSRISGMWHSGSAFALHAEGEGFNPPHLQIRAMFEWSRVRLTLGAFSALIAQWQSVRLQSSFEILLETPKLLLFLHNTKTQIWIPILLKKHQHMMCSF
jgi:hypothetical protein